MNRTFVYSFDPPAQDPVGGPTVELTVQQIEDAGVREVLQTPGVAYGSWSVLDALLQPTGTGTPFIFREPLGQAREVKVALSGLFGRFVARAYLERYFDVAVFAHLNQRIIHLDRRRRIRIEKLAGKGDLPDWVACPADLSRLFVAEAKGCHDRAGPASTLERAWKQAQRIDVYAGNRPVIPLKRIAIATRWGAARGGAAEARMSVRDPEDEGEPATSDELDATLVGLTRLHVAGLLAPLGHGELADALRELASAPSALGERRANGRARQALDGALVGEVSGGPTRQPIDGLIGGVVTRAGPVGSAHVDEADQQALARLALRPIFVGVEREVIAAAVQGDASKLREVMKLSREDEVARPDRAGGWIVPLGDRRRIITGG